MRRRWRERGGGDGSGEEVVGKREEWTHFSCAPWVKEIAEGVGVVVVVGVVKVVVVGIVVVVVVVSAAAAVLSSK